jgi:hypothetical protein
MRQLTLLLLMALCTLGLAAPFAVGAAHSTTVEPARTPLDRFTLKASNGYSAAVEGYGRTVKLTVSKGLTAVEYTTYGKIARGQIRARFGKLGVISTHFDPIGKASDIEPPGGCRGSPAMRRSGIFVGTVVFVGERHYTEIDADRARGSTISPRWRCKQTVGLGGLPFTFHIPGGTSAALSVATPNGNRQFVALGTSNNPGICVFVLETAAHMGSLSIKRVVSAFGETSAFTFDDALSVATVGPPRPFHGTARFSRSPSGLTTWTGSLSVSLPGQREIALTGPHFSASLYSPQ